MTLTFDLVTLTLGQLQRLININNICKYHQDQSIRSWFIGKKHLLRTSVARGRRPRDNAINLVKRFDTKYDWPSQEVSSRSINTFMSYSQNYFFHINAYMTLTFDLVTLTLGQLQRLININNICKYHQDPSIRPWFIGQNHSIRRTLGHSDTQALRQTDRWACRVALQLMLAAQLKVTNILKDAHIIQGNAEYFRLKRKEDKWTQKVRTCPRQLFKSVYSS